MSKKTPLSRVDLNLLVALDVLLEERSVTKAAERLFITQPAMSKTLSRLRDLFDDPLFTRAAKGLTPTPLAEQLHSELPQVLTHIEQMLFHEAFNPAEAEGTISIALPVVISAALTPSLLSELLDQAPKLKLKTINVTEDHSERLRTGELDFSVFYQHQVGEDFTSYPLKRDIPVVCMMRADHPLKDKVDVTMEDLRHYEHIAFSLPNINDPSLLPLKGFMQANQLDDKVIFETNHLFTSLEILIHSDTILLVPDIFALCALGRGRFITRPLPEKHQGLQKLPTLHLIQHNRTLNSPLHTWVREVIFSLINREYSEEEIAEYLEQIGSEN